MRTLLEWTRRLMGSLRRRRSDADLEEELRLHLEFAADEERRRGAPEPDAARAARVRAGSIPIAMDSLRDQRGLPSLDALASDTVFGWRQIVRHRTASLSVVLSLGLAMGATMAAFRLVDAVLLRPLAVADPSRLYVLAFNVVGADGGTEERDDFDYPTFRKYVAASEGRADVMLMGMANPQRIQIDGGSPEKAVQQFVSGNAFGTLGLQPELGRLLGAADDVTPGGHPVAVISHDFWRRRFGADPAVVGRTFNMGARPIEIVGVAPEGFTGTEPGIVTDFFIPATMNAEALNVVGWSWFRIWLRPKIGVDVTQVGALLQAQYQADKLARVKKFAPETPKSRIDAFMAQQLLLQPAGSGASGIQRSFRRPLWILAGLAALLLVIACANAGNLLLARAMSRRSEMALRVSIGASQGRLVQLMLVESALLAVLACAAGLVFAAWAAPFVVTMLSPPQRPIRLVLDPDWRMFALAGTVTVAVIVMFGLAPAVRAALTTPVGALKEMRGARGQRRVTDLFVVAQMACCVFLLLGASLFLGTFERLQNKPLGFEPARLLHISVESRTPLTAAAWHELTRRLGELPRVESAAIAGWAPLTGNRWRSSISVDGRSSEPSAPNWVSVSPGYFRTIGTPLLEGRDFRSGDLPPDKNRRPSAGVAIVNQSFARVYMGGGSPVGRQVIVDSGSVPFEIVGMTADAVDFSVRDEMQPAVFIPLERRQGATLLARTTAGGQDLPAVLSREIPRIAPEISVREAVPFEAFVLQQMIRERLLAVLSTFFAVLALLLAIIGIYGVLNYAVNRERRDIGLRMALGARPLHVFSLLTRRLVVVISIGAAAGVAGGVAFGRTVQALLFNMEPSHPATLLMPILALATAAVLAAIPPALRAVRIDPAQTLKSEG